MSTGHLESGCSRSIRASRSQTANQINRNLIHLPTLAVNFHVVGSIIVEGFALACVVLSDGARGFPGTVRGPADAEGWLTADPCTVCAM